ncbi:MAG: hypothetical protein BGO28_04685 [Alphaproteobacteria bacterium 43-37]|nr:MAG: hypothetical protein BGO28_04685 [Alphaproteobacteria bacterium 43-37]
MNATQPNDHQRKLTDIHACIWVAASAGTGKTKALTDRVLSLLIQGVDVRNILCLTFTNAAAFEMKHRVFQRLQQYSHATPDTLSNELQSLLGRSATEQEFDQSKRLFYELVDRLHLLNITTIHGFCFNLLQQFPHEAGIPLLCEVMDESEQARLTNQVFQELLNSSDFEVLEALDTLTQATSENQLKEILVNYIQFAIIKGRTNKSSILENEWLNETRQYLDQMFGNHDETRATPIHIREEISTCLTTIQYSQENLDISLHTALSALATVEDEFDHLESIFLTADGNIRKKLCSAKTLKAFPNLIERLDRISQWVFETKEMFTCQKLKEFNHALNIVTQKFLGKMEDEKMKRQALDYSDIIEKTLLLLSNPSYADWIAYKLGYTFHHVLVDEAQDTSPLQWQLILRLTEDFFASDLAPKSVFIVGDIKQSIYSFQGAYAESFQYFYELLKNKTLAHEKPWWDLRLKYSYRTTQPLLDVIDKAFNTLSINLSDMDGPLGQLSARRTKGHHYGRVCFQPLIKSEDTNIASTDRLAQLLAEEIASDLENGRWLENHNRLAHAGDFLILVQQRGPLTSSLYKWFHQYGIPVAPPDRIKLMEQMCVQDCLAFAKLMLNQNDQMSLAQVLTGPIFGLKLADIITSHLASEGDSLWERLASLSPFSDAITMLTNWQELAQTLPPTTFLTRLIMEYEAKFIQSYGIASLEALDGFLSRIHSLAKGCYSLQSIVDNFESVASAPYKRLPSQDRESVRIMTVHGAKGLQAPIVILADTHRGLETDHGFVLDEQNVNARALWIPKKSYRVPSLTSAMETFEASALHEYYRLLYVAMTRCEDELIICGIGGHRRSSRSSQDHPLTWYDAIKQSLGINNDEEAEETLNQLTPLFENQAKVFRSNNISALFSDTVPSFEEFLGIKPYEKLSLPVVSKEDSQATSPSTNYGTLVHQLLHLLSNTLPGNRQALVTYFYQQNPVISMDECQQILGLFQNSSLSWIWEAEGENELEIMSPTPNQNRALMRIDRLVKLPNKWVVIDYKTGSPENTSSELLATYQNQLHQYISALQPLTHLLIEGAILWVQSGDLFAITNASLSS